ncbi:hypothetical protein PIB30_079702, partial [Stylosanthes scabra]|nr:hypothetical protein [Stylosanthes scabra]
MGGTLKAIKEMNIESFSWKMLFVREARYRIDTEPREVGFAASRHDLVRVVDDVFERVRDTAIDIIVLDHNENESKQ